MAEQAALEQAPKSNRIKAKVWSATSGAVAGSAVGILALAQPLAELTEEALCMFAICPSPRAVLNLVTVNTVILSGLGAWLGGYLKKETR